MQEGLEMTAIQMSPSTLLAMVVDRPIPLALWAGEGLSFRVFDPDIHTPLFYGKLNVADRPRRLYAQQMPVKLNVAQGLPPKYRKNPAFYAKPTQKPEVHRNVFAIRNLFHGIQVLLRNIFLQKGGTQGTGMDLGN